MSIIHRKTNWLICFAAVCLISSSAIAVCTRPLIFAYSDWGRLESKAEQRFRLDEELTEIIFNTAKCQLSWQPMTNKRVVEAVKYGLVDGAIGMSFTPERETFGWFTPHYRQEIIAMFVLKETLPNLQVTSLQDLLNPNLRIGAGIGSWHGPEFENLQTEHPDFNNRILYTDSVKLMYDWLLRKRVTITFNDLHYGLHILKQRNLDDRVGVHPFYIHDNFVHILLSKKTVQLADKKIINNAVKKALTTPAFQAKLEQYPSP